MELEWSWSFAWEILPDLLAGALKTLAAVGIGYSIALVGGLILALLQRIRSQLVTAAVREFVEFIRSTPLLLQIYFVFFVGPQFGVQLSPWVSGLIAIGLYRSAYLSEIYRGGLEAVPAGQWEACAALNLSGRDTYFRIIIPQALPPAMAGMGNALIAIFKDTPMLSAIGVAELMHAATVVGTNSYRYLEPYTLVGVLFLLLSLPAAWVIRIFERWLRSRLGMV
ncbi:ectoine/hydroxyectoine ABC transporter permease subunit EhuD [Bradyrhizobium sp. SSUT77]|uniref:ectoine/hydroxyectoine ABC transporter permease subunit EhuD n=1 Tax=Bradyrhizobium sp. SSUT77 TaxID=3040603 RepID=UPI002446D781|nr:ectoine/hydroxyectoine ABC transporter permease subunit EhuD [Bradyrhizobium sp. SSUT77]MDH2348372.1 ectoine/hydroxyectoine ABC transporter permease subunit EhuD [Bradyrhizobium sp. SSUT77]